MSVNLSKIRKNKMKKLLLKRKSTEKLYNPG